MNPFRLFWWPLEQHNRDGCNALDNRYIELKNSAAVPDVTEVRGCVVLIAGRSRTGGKSVLSHQILHKLERHGFFAIDLAAVWHDRNKAGDGDLAWFRKSVVLANVGNILADDAMTRILSEDAGNDWEIMNIRFRRELKGYPVVIRMPALDPFLDPEAVARNISYYAESASFLEDSVYLYEYSYADVEDWQLLQESLNLLGARNVRIAEVQTLLVDDAMKFIEEHLANYRPWIPGAVNLAEIKRIFEYLFDPASGGLECTIGGLSEVMYRAFRRCEPDKSEQYLIKYIIEEYIRWRG